MHFSGIYLVRLMTISRVHMTRPAATHRVETVTISCTACVAELRLSRHLSLTTSPPREYRRLRHRRRQDVKSREPFVLAVVIGQQFHFVFKIDHEVATAFKCRKQEDDGSDARNKAAKGRDSLHFGQGMTTNCCCFCIQLRLSTV